MPSATYSFLDVAVLDEVRSRFAASDALLILSADLEQVIWTNGPGAALLGHADIDSAIGSSAALPPVARRQVMATSGYPDIGRDRALMLRIATGMTSQAVRCLASAITMPDGEKAVLLAVPAANAESHGAADIAARAIGGFTQDGQFLAFIDAQGNVEAASDGFEALGIARQTLAALAAERGGGGERIVRRRVQAGSRSLPAGLARLVDEPAKHLLVVIDEEEAEMPAAAGVGEQPGVAARQAPGTEETAPDAEPSGAETTAAPVAEGHQHDHWYFNGERGAAQSGKTAEDGAPSPRPSAERSLAETGERAAPPVRFVWRTDADGAFSAISPEFAATVGEPAADIVGRRFRDVATAFDLDPSGEIAGLLQRRDTWSGRTVLWPVAGTGLRVPVDLAALPIYDRNRVFEGFRGFGVARMADAVPDPEGIALALTPNAPPSEADDVAGTSASQDESEKEEPPAGPTAAPPGSDPFRGEVPALAIVSKPDRRFTDKVIRLAEHRQAAPDRALSVVERSAFREIGERLKKDSTHSGQGPDAPDAGNSPAEAKAPPAPPASEQPQPKEPPHTKRPARSLLDLVERHTGLLAKEGAQEDADSIAAADLADARDDETLPAAKEQQPAAPRAADTTVSSGTDQPATAAEPSPQEAPKQQPAVARQFEAGPGHDDGFLPAAFATAARPEPETSILAKLPVPLLIHSGDVLHYANEEFLALTGYADLDDLDEAGGLGALFADPYPHEDGTGDGSDRALRIHTRDGREFPADAILRSVPWKGRKALMLVVRRHGDEVLQHAAQAAGQATSLGQAQPDISGLKARVAEMRTIIDTATDGVVLIDRDGTIRSISRPAEALFGFDSDDVAGKPFASLFAIESQRAARDYLNGLSDHGVASVLNDGREVIGREAQGRFIPLFMTIGRLPNDSGFCAVMRDITQWKRAEEDLTQARAVAERASSQKTDFLARISHEIRTPLNAIIGFSELMVDEKFGPIANDRYRDYLRDINRSGNHVLDLVNDLLDISKIEAGQQEMDYEAVSLNDTLAETVAMMQPQANRERVIIRSSFASKLPEVVADLRSVRQVALNILSNAIRYTQAGGQVIVSTAYEASGDVVMRVRDTGVGMTQAEIEQALKPFKQINALKRGRGDGTGLGLPLTKAMVEANRARFTITSTPGEGTLVEIAFPSTRVLAE
ncbi:PAS domain S-box protein [Mesorhizobium sp. SP-1A]|uniref:PAS domain S-box protein n=1 Tax=Mesorhizobium sp. SP-1A TaxID=3077840 RepID=UPI0028F6FA6A|nr:PAS domain S-box protein [Mesorhizobium sp. SP-1A]